MTQPRFAVWVPEATIRGLLVGDTLVQALKESDGERSRGRNWEVGLEERSDGTRLFVLTLPPGVAPLFPNEAAEQAKQAAHALDCSVAELVDVVEDTDIAKMTANRRKHTKPVEIPPEPKDPEAGDELVESLQSLSGRLAGTGRAERAAEAIRAAIDERTGRG